MRHDQGNCSCACTKCNRARSYNGRFSSTLFGDNVPHCQKRRKECHA